MTGDFHPAHHIHQLRFQAGAAAQPVGVAHLAQRMAIIDVGDLGQQ